MLRESITIFHHTDYRRHSPEDKYFHNYLCKKIETGTKIRVHFTGTDYSCDGVLIYKHFMAVGFYPHLRHSDGREELILGYDIVTLIDSKRAARNTRKDRKMENATQTVSQVEKIWLSIEETVNHLFQIFKEAPSAVRSRTFNRDAQKFNYAVNYEEAVNILVADGRLRRSSKGALTVIAPRAPKIATEAAPIPAEGSPLAEVLARAEAELVGG